MEGSYGARLRKALDERTVRVELPLLLVGLSKLSLEQIDDLLYLLDDVLDDGHEVGAERETRARVGR